MITLSKPIVLSFSSCSNVKTDPEINGWPNLFPKSDAPFEALIKISTGFWYSQFLSFVENFLFFSILGYEVMYTAVPARGRDPFPPANRSLISPPDPVAAPLNGSTVVGKL